MLEHTKIKIGDREIEAVSFGLNGRNLIVLRGSRGYVMCGYLNIEAAEKFGDAAVKITGVSTIDEALKAKVADCTSRAGEMGISAAQPIQDVLKIIA
jgi:uncharacterized protein YunC (DUF1805 family)